MQVLFETYLSPSQCLLLGTTTFTVAITANLVDRGINRQIDTAVHPRSNLELGNVTENDL